MTGAAGARIRWDDYVFTADTNSSCRTIADAAKLGSGRVLLVCGGGFDPRTLDAPRAIATLGIDTLDVIALQPNAEGLHDQAESEATRNVAELEQRFGGRFRVVRSPEVAEVNSAGTMLSRILVHNHDVLSYDAVIIDMSGLPSTISFSVIQLFLNQSVAASDRFDGNLLVVVAEDATVDEQIRRSGLGRPSVLNSLTRFPDRPANVIWIPVLGPGSSEQLEKLRGMLDPEEVCPVVPFPASFARRGDNLIVEHGTFLFDEMQFEPRNVLYATELNPFDLYRQMVSLARRYRTALDPLGEPTIVTSEHGSKLLSLGVLLAAHEEHIVVAQVDAQAYRFESSETASRREPVIYTAWLTGEPYAVSGRQDDVSDA
ncbi:hypothetical protein [Plantibacter sp. CFBP 8775]|uniref:hypothetical protein n=1 Tax=Plantibacter sp. CFBP 8775 TaxID=2774038 RepID=UPI0017850339|nr:hypothetical protein [Plantibacter sp. CFBP 8775]MBD8103219.1 hypothetical protein [Plantibacter sp. CFBP 8775]